VNSVKERKGKKERQNLKTLLAEGGSGAVREGERGKNKTRKKRKREDEPEITQAKSIQDEEVGHQTKKRKRRHKKATLNG